jgi:hypothetical protein
MKIEKFLIKIFFTIIFLSFIFCTNLFSQNNLDTTQINEKSIEEVEEKVKENLYLPLSKSPSGAIWRSVIFPGWGQLYTENYWKAPIFSAAAGTLWYLTISNHLEYNDLQKQLNSIEDKNSLEWQNTRSRRENSIDNRDLFALYLLGVYVIAIIDAYSSVHLFDFNIGNPPNNSFSIQKFSPQISPNSFFDGKIYLKFGISYKF